MAITLSKQYNFKLNEATMEQARNIIKEKGNDNDRCYFFICGANSPGTRFAY